MPYAPPMDLLKRLSEAPGVPGREERVRAVVEEAVKPLVRSVRVDALGNLIAHRPADGKPKAKVMLAAHMDEIGFLVKHVDEKGFIRVHNTGGFDVRNLFAREVLVHGREELEGVLNPVIRPIHVATDEEKKKDLKIKDFFVDVGLNAERVNALVRVGDMVTLRKGFREFGEVVSGKAMDDRASIYVMIEALRRLERSPFEVFAVATTQEEVGLRGAMVSAYDIEPDIAIALDVTLAVDIPGLKADEYITELGKGCGIKIMDSASISDRGLVDEFVSYAEKGGIPYQLEVLPLGGTDAGTMQRARRGSRAITLSLPTRYIHTVVETVHRADLEAEIALLVAYLRA